MNTTEKIICLVLGAVLAWYIFLEMPRESQARADAAKAAQAAASAPAAEGSDRSPMAKRVGEAAAAAVQSVENAAAAVSKAATEAKAAFDKVLEKPATPERTVVLENDELKLVLSTWGAVVKKATLKRYACDIGEISDKNPAVELDFSASPLGQLVGVDGIAPNAAYEVKSQASNRVVFASASATRTVTLEGGYRVVYAEEFRGAGGASPLNGGSSMSLGVMAMGSSKNDLLSVDSLDAFNEKGKPEVLHHCEGDSPLKAYLVGGLSGGCSGSSSAAGMPERTLVGIDDEQKWIAVKNRFFVTALASSDVAISGFDAEIARDMNSANYRPRSVSLRAKFAASEAGRRTTTFYVGPKKQALLWDLGMRDVMEFGMWRWLCYPLVGVLNFFNGLIPNYGIAIILLTILVRLVFWPLTHKSTVGMRKMQELQPLMKEIQAKYKDNPQRMQQETWALYREKKVNPLSSCLPMLIQIPVFIALFNVLRSAVELRYAPFLWISDLSEPEGLFASWFPFGGLNLLPILMAVSTGLQSAFTPSTGDKNQQKMMMIFMPLMMLVMFYSFPSALSLYWFLSNLFSIVQMWLIRRSVANDGKSGALVPEVIDPVAPVTRQMRRHG